MTSLEETKRGVPRKNFLYIAITFSVCSLLLLGYVRFAYPSNSHRQIVDEIKLGGSADELLLEFERDPDHRISTDDWAVWYFSSNSRIANDIREAQGPPQFNSTASSYAGLPDMYDHAQFLIGKNDVILAETVNGEDLTIDTVIGEFRGANINKLPPGIFRELVKHETD